MEDFTFNASPVSSENNGDQPKSRVKLHNRTVQRCGRKRSRKFFGKTYMFFIEWIVYYITFFFFMLAIASFFSLIFLVPFFIDPAWSTLQADFDPEVRDCTTVSGRYTKGLNHADLLLVGLSFTIACVDRPFQL